MARYIDINAHKQSIKLMLFELFSDNKQNKVREQLDSENINKLIKGTLNTKGAIDKIKVALNNYVKSFDHETVRKIDTVYNNIADFSNIAHFDWLGLLKKFDSEITDLNFNYKPDYEMIEGKYVLDELISLNDYLVTIDFNKDWKTFFEYLKAVSGDDGIITFAKKMIQVCKELSRDNHITKIIKLIFKDPYFEPKEFPSKVKIVQDHIMSFQQEVKHSVDVALKGLKKEKIDKLLLSIFHKTVIIRLKHYTIKLNDLVLKRNLRGFQFIEPLNYAKAFVLDYCKGEIKSRIDTLLIKGTWSTNVYSSEYSQLLEQFNVISDRIVEFDNSCSEDESNGRSVRKLAFAMKHDSGAKNTLARLIIKIDGEAQQILIDTIKMLLFTAGKIKTIIEDYKTKNPKIIIDSHKVKWPFDEEFDVEFSRFHNKLVNFVALLKFFVKSQNNEKK